MTPTRYATSAIAAHWLVAVLIFVAFPLGVYMHDLPLSPLKLQLFSYHKWIGMTVLLLFLPRLLVRLFVAVPPTLPAPAWQLKVAELTHVLLYVLVFAVPLSGWLMSSAKGFQVVYLGLLPLPDLVSKNAELGGLLKAVHQTLNLALFGLVGLHIAAAAKHHVIDRDATLRRMSPFGK